jgi:hypothetical protein
MENTQQRVLTRWPVWNRGIENVGTIGSAGKKLKNTGKSMKECLDHMNK